MYRLKLLDKAEEPTDLLNNMALIIVKNMYGENYGIKVAHISLFQVMVLSSFNDAPYKPSIKDLNSALGTEGLIYKYEMLTQNPTITEQKSSLESESGLRFFDEKEVRRSAHIILPQLTNHFYAMIEEYKYT